MMKFFYDLMTFTMMLMMLMIMLSFTMKSPHPVIMLIMLILYSIMVCLIMSKWSQNFIYSIMLFLIMISGLLIIFLYFSSLISNEQNNLSFSLLMMINFMVNMIFMMFFYMTNLTNYPIYTFMENMKMTYSNSNLFQNIAYIYSYPFNNLTLICMFYLLITLLMIIKICSIKNSSLRKLK